MIVHQRHYPVCFVIEEQAICCSEWTLFEAQFAIMS